MVRKFQNIAFGYAIPSYFHNIESTLHIYVHVYYITLEADLQDTLLFNYFKSQQTNALIKMKKIKLGGGYVP